MVEPDRQHNLIILNGIQIPVDNICIDRHIPMTQVETAPRQAMKPGWSSVCACGQDHKVTEDGNITGADWVVVDEYWCDDCQDMHEKTELHCLFCSHTVEPEWITLPAGTALIVTGVPMYTINGHVPLHSQLSIGEFVQIEVALGAGDADAIYEGVFHSTTSHHRGAAGYMDFTFKGKIINDQGDTS